MSNIKCPVCIQGITKELRPIYGIDIITPCCICHDKINIPVITDCGHTFCKGCISKHLNIPNKFDNERLIELENENKELKERLRHYEDEIEDIGFEYNLKLNEIDTMKIEYEKLVEINYNIQIEKGTLTRKNIILEKENENFKFENIRFSTLIIELKNKKNLLLDENIKLKKIAKQEDITKEINYSNILIKPIKLPRQKDPPITFELLEPPKQHNFTKLKIKKKFKNPFSEDN
jgi:hypothetical protein